MEHTAYVSTGMLAYTPSIDPVVGSIDHHTKSIDARIGDRPDPHKRVPSGEKVVVEESYRRAMAAVGLPVV